MWPSNRDVYRIMGCIIREDRSGRGGLLAYNKTKIEKGRAVMHHVFLALVGIIISAVIVLMIVQADSAIVRLMRGEGWAMRGLLGAVVVIFTCGMAVYIGRILRFFLYIL